MYAVLYCSSLSLLFCFLVTLSAPSKTFNIPVFAFSFVITTNPKLRTDFETAQGNASVFMENVFGLLLPTSLLLLFSFLAPPAVCAGYTECYDWVRETDALYLSHMQYIIQEIEKPDMRGLIQTVHPEVCFHPTVVLHCLFR